MPKPEHKPLRSADWKQELIRAIILYATDAPGFDNQYAEIEHRLSSVQKMELESWIAFADKVIVEAGVGSVTQPEVYLAAPEDRETRFKPQLETQTFGANLRRIRKSRKITQVRLGKLSGIASNYISELEASKTTNPSLSTLNKLAEALVCSVGDLADQQRGPH